MVEGIGAFDLDDYRALLRLAEDKVGFAATIARATLAIVEARRDAEVRAAAAEAALEAEQRRLDAVRELVAAHPAEGGDPDELHRQILLILR